MLKTIPAAQLRVGMHLHQLCGPWMHHPFWRTRFVLSDPKDIAAILSSGVPACVIDVSKGLDIAEDRAEHPVPASSHTVDQPQPKPPAATPTPSSRAPTCLHEESVRAANLVSQSKRLVSSLHSQVRMGKALDTAGCTELIDDVTASIFRNQEAMVSLVRLKTHDDYTYMHSVAVCALMGALSRQLGHTEAAAREAGMAGLLHDIGKAALPLPVLNKPGKLTESDFQIVRAHPERGHAMLSSTDLSDSPWLTDAVLDVCLHHHEKIDGTGDPHRLAGDQISLFARMGSICDVYDAITSNRPYKAAWDPADSIGKMASWRKGHFDEAIFQSFVRSVGIYPIGSLVRMESGKLAVVVETNPAAATSPKVKTFYSTRSNMPMTPQLLDLSRPGCPDRIVGRESNSVWKFPHLDSLWADPEALARLGRS
jgi:HD-GYP domain-containing protein (c-di-GMP phosphodiesterase class II)